MTWRWVLLETVLAIHDRQIAEHGGLPGVRDLGLVRGALARPQNLIRYASPGVNELAAAYAWGLIRDHGFMDGNKRTAYVTSRLFLRMNGYDLVAPLVERVMVFTDAGARRLEEQDLADWFGRHTRSIG